MGAGWLVERAGGRVLRSPSRSSGTGVRREDGQRGQGSLEQPALVRQPARLPVREFDVDVDVGRVAVRPQPPPEDEIGDRQEMVTRPSATSVRTCCAIGKSG